MMEVMKRGFIVALVFFFVVGAVLPVIGFGQAGAKLAIRAGAEIPNSIVVLANISGDELNSATKVPTDMKIHIGNGKFEGGGGLRETTYTNVVKPHYKEVVAEIISKIHGVYFAYCFGSSGGATGAANVPLVAAALNTKASIEAVGNKNFSAFGVVTDIESTEGRNEHNNCLETLNQINNKVTMEKLPL